MVFHVVDGQAGAGSTAGAGLNAELRTWAAGAVQGLAGGGHGHGKVQVGRLMDHHLEFMAALQ